MIIEDEIYDLQYLISESILSDVFWKSLINQKVRHSKYGLGIVVGFETRKNDEAIITIQFDINHKKSCKEFQFSSLSNNSFTLENEIKLKLDRYLKAIKARNEIKVKRAMYNDFDWNEHIKNRWKRSFKKYAGIPGLGKRR